MDGVHFWRLGVSINFARGFDFEMSRTASAAMERWKLSKHQGISNRLKILGVWEWGWLVIGCHPCRFSKVGVSIPERSSTDWVMCIFLRPSFSHVLKDNNCWVVVNTIILCNTQWERVWGCFAVVRGEWMNGKRWGCYELCRWTVSEALMHLSWGLWVALFFMHGLGDVFFLLFFFRESWLTDDLPGRRSLLVVAFRCSGGRAGGGLVGPELLHVQVANG